MRLTTHIDHPAHDPIVVVYPSRYLAMRPFVDVEPSLRVETSSTIFAYVLPLHAPVLVERYPPRACISPQSHRHRFCFHCGPKFETAEEAEGAKAFYRKGMALDGIGDHKTACGVLQQAASV